jgi:quercetin dioxygenase-like cupin family protein
MKVIDVPNDPEVGAPRETKPLFSGPGRKLTQMTLRRGASLAEHVSPDPLIIECVAGTGTLTTGGQQLPLFQGRRVALDAGEPHAVVADAFLTLILTRCSSAARPAAHSHGASQ